MMVLITMTTRSLPGIAVVTSVIVTVGFDQVGYHHGLRTMHEYGFMNFNKLAPAYGLGFFSAALGILFGICIFAWFMAQEQHIHYHYTSRD